MSLMMAALAGAALAGQSHLVERADETNLAYVSCLFATARESSRDLSPDQLYQVLTSSCVQERQDFRTAFVAVRQSQGLSAQQALAEWQALEQQGLASVVAARTGAKPTG